MTDDDAIKLGATHKHWKGGYYRLLNDGTLENTLQPVKVYCHVGPKGPLKRVWVRLSEDWNAWVMNPQTGEKVRRFTKLTEEPEAGPYFGADDPS